LGEVEGVRPGGQIKFGVRLMKKIVWPNKYATKMLWTVENGES